MANDKLPERTGRAERHQAQAAAAKAEQVKIDSFSVLDRFATRREAGATEGYTYQRGE